MAFIAVHAKHDISGDKKGIVTPSQMAIINAFSLTSKTGILNFGNKCSLVSSSVSAIENKATVTFNSGYIVICGRLVECEQGTTYDITTPTTGTKTGTIILRFNLNGIGKEEFQLTETSNELIQQDLNQNTVTGIYEFPLYKYTATETSVALTKVETNTIYDFDEAISNLLTGTGMINSGSAPLQGYDRSKGTIEERLTKSISGDIKEHTVSLFSCFYYASLNKTYSFFSQENPFVFTIRKISDDFLVSVLPQGGPQTRIESYEGTQVGLNEYMWSFFINTKTTSHAEKQAFFSNDFTNRGAYILPDEFRPKSDFTFYLPFWLDLSLYNFTNDMINITASSEWQITIKTNGQIILTNFRDRLFTMEDDYWGKIYGNVGFHNFKSTYWM